MIANPHGTSEGYDGVEIAIEYRCALGRWHSKLTAIPVHADFIRIPSGTSPGGDSLGRHIVL